MLLPEVTDSPGSGPDPIHARLLGTRGAPHPPRSGWHISLSKYRKTQIFRAFAVHSFNRRSWAPPGPPCHAGLGMLPRSRGRLGHPPALGTHTHSLTLPACLTWNQGPRAPWSSDSSKKFEIRSQKWPLTQGCEAPRGFRFRGSFRPAVTSRAPALA